MLDTDKGGVSAQLMRMQKKGTLRGEKIAVKGPNCNEFYQRTMGVIDGLCYTCTFHFFIKPLSSLLACSES